MLILDSTSKSLRVRLAAAHTTTALRCVTSWRDVSTLVFTPGSTLESTNGTTPVEIAPEPSSGYQRVIDYVSILNTDTVNHTPTIYIYDGSTNYDMITVTIGAGERIEYSEGKGFNVYNAAGSLKTVTVATQNVVGSGWSTTVLGSDITNNNASANTIADVTGLSFAVVSGTRYAFEFVINYTSAATTTGSRWSVNGPSSPTELMYLTSYIGVTAPATAGTDNFSECIQTAYDLPAAATASSGTAANMARITGFVKPSADGTFIARFASEVSSSAVIAKAGSFVRYIALV